MTQNSSTPKRILMMAAGTGGHVFPALAVAKQLMAQGHDVQWLGTPQGMENRLLADEDITLHQVAMKGMRGNGLMRLVKMPFMLLGATVSAMRILKAQKIDVVAGFGGYVAAPGGLAAKILGIPLVIHEQNAIAGMTNTYLAKLSKSVMEAFPNTFPASSKVTAVGNPVRDAIVQVGKEAQSDIATTPAQKTHFNLLVIGGSLGAQVLNENMPKALALLTQKLEEKKLKDQASERVALTVRHQCGRGHLETTQANYANANPNVAYEVTEFVKDMASAYRQTDVLLCRAGASTVSEVAVAGVPAIFVPLPHAVDDHQTANARFLSDHQAGVLMPQSELTPEALADKLLELLDSATLARLSQHALARGIPDSTALAAEIVLTAAK